MGGGSFGTPGGGGFSANPGQSFFLVQKPPHQTLRLFGGGGLGESGFSGGGFGGGLGGGQFGGGAIPVANSLEEPDDADWLLDFIMKHSAGPWQDVDGEGGTVNVFGNVMIVRQQLQVLLEVEQLLNALLKTASSGSAPLASFRAVDVMYPLDRDQ